MNTNITRIMSSIRTSKPLFITLCAVAALVLIALVLIAFRAYPIAFVNGKPIMAYQYDKGFDVAYRYYAFFNSHRKDTPPMKDADLQKWLRKAAFESLIDDILVEKRLSHDMKSSELQQKIDEQVGIVMNDEQARRSLLSMTQASEGDAREYFLDSLVRYQILKGQLDLEGVNVDEWMLQERKNSSVTVLMPSMKWNGQEIEAK